LLHFSQRRQALCQSFPSDVFLSAVDTKKKLNLSAVRKAEMLPDNTRQFDSPKISTTLISNAFLQLDNTMHKPDIYYLSLEVTEGPETISGLFV
jgi:hypothetical protein